MKMTRYTDNHWADVLTGCVWQAQRGMEIEELQGLFRLVKGFIKLLLGLLYLLRKPTPEGRKRAVCQTLPLKIMTWKTKMMAMIDQLFMCILPRLGYELALLQLLQGACGLLSQAFSKLLEFWLEIGKVLLNCGLLYGLCVKRINCLSQQKPLRNGVKNNNVDVVYKGLSLTRVCNQHKH